MDSELLSHPALLEEMYAKYAADPSSVDRSWKHFFEGMAFAESSEKKNVPSDLKIYNLINAYRSYGHLLADCNPLSEPKKSVRELDLKELGFEESELKTIFPTGGILQAKQAPLSEIIDALKKIYCGKIGVEYMGLGSPELEKWLQKRIEKTRFRPTFSSEKKKAILYQLGKSELFETFLHTKYVGQKRFSLEGGETLIPLLSEIIETGADFGMEELVLGMAHRGRLNVLTTIFGKSFSMVFGEFEDFLDPSLGEGSGDVKYHKGFSANIKSKTGKDIHLALTANPSHLESVGPVVEGKTYAKQVERGDHEKNRTVPLVIHGDASLSGQGVVYENMQLYKLPGYSTGGTIHIVVNNQIGFTTLPKDSRSTTYCTDIAKAFSAPVFHVNAEDPEGCVYVAELAMKIRQEFHTDVFIDMICYRKYGHNEGDEPAFTQPREYQKIRSKLPIREHYFKRLLDENIVDKPSLQALEEGFKQDLHAELEERKIKKEQDPQEAFGGIWKDYKGATTQDIFRPVVTAVNTALIGDLASIFCRLPKDFTPHPKVAKLLEERLKMAAGTAKIDWAMAESLAFATLLAEGTPIRVSGQDSRRGTFSQRHAAIFDQQTGRDYVPLAHLKEGQGRFDVIDSPLSEYAVLAFEFGYSLSCPSGLCIWEAQFGDFANGGQIVMDQYLAASEQKWSRTSGLVLLLPHGYEGQGPEHSSARIERFLQLAGSGNMQVTYPTTPAQYFHLLRRQVRRDFRKPLIVFTPKGLLRLAGCVSSVEDLGSGTFEEVLDDPLRPTKATRILLCSGRIYYDLIRQRESLKEEGVAIIRIEQLYPLNYEKLKALLDAYAEVQEYRWVQEEPKNMGAWTTIASKLYEHFPKGFRLRYVGRPSAASTATGSHRMHVKEQAAILETAFSALKVKR